MSYHPNAITFAMMSQHPAKSRGPPQLSTFPEKQKSRTKFN